jgi:hypothetical protein
LNGFGVNSFKNSRTMNVHSFTFLVVLKFAIETVKRSHVLDNV